MAEDKQATSQSSMDDRKKEAEARKAVAEAEKAEAEAKQAQIKAQLPPGEAKPVEGKITTDDKAGYIATFAAYDALVQKADEIAIKINSMSLEKARILIIDSLDFASSDVQLIQVLKQISYWDGELNAHLEKIKVFIKEIGKVSKPAWPPELSLAEKTGLVEVGAGLQIAKGVVSSLADIVGYFRVDYDIKGQTINLSNIALHSLVAGRIAASGHSVFLPGFYHIEPSAVINVLEDFNKSITGKDRLKVAITNLKESLLDPQVVKKKKDGTPEGKSLISEAEKACENAETLIKEFAEFNKALTSAPQGGGYSPLAAAALRQYLDTKGITHLLYLTVTSGGGEMVIGRGLFYWGSVGFLGGCVVTYVLAKCSGEIMAADTAFGYSSVKYHLCRNKLTPFKHPEIKKQTP